MFNTSIELYREFDISDDWQQGDIIGDLYVTRVIEDDMYLYRPHPEESARISRLTQLAEQFNDVKAPFDNKHRRENAVIPVIRTDVMILSQTCDVLHDEKLTVVRVRPLLHIGKAKENVRRGEVMYAFYLPNYPANGDESFADLTELTVISKDLLIAHQEKRRKSLTVNGLRLFQAFVQRFFCREAMPDDVAKIITVFHRSLKQSGIESKLSRIYYDYSTEKITLLVALDNDDENAQAVIETATQYANKSVEHRYELQVAYKLIDNIMLRDIDGFREFY